MKKVIYACLFFIIIFLLNIGFYFFNDSYRDFVKNIKYSSEEQTDDFVFNDSYFTDEEIDKNQDCNCETTTLNQEESVLSDDNSDLETNEDIFTTDTQVDDIAIKKLIDDELQMSYSGVINETLNVFGGEYILQPKKYDADFELFGLTDEYPKHYLTYINSKFELYIFVEGNYDNLFNTFTYLGSELNFELNRTNTFGNRSFFINSPQKDYVRVIIKHSNKLFGLKIGKQYYEEIKQILNKL